MAAGVLRQTVTTTTGETIELAFWVNDTVSPTQWTPVTALINTSDAAITFNSNGQAIAANSAPVALAADKGLQTQNFAVAGATLTRSSTTTAYAALDSVSDNTVAGSVTALTTNNLSDTNDYPVCITHVRLAFNDTVVGATGNGYRLYLYSSNPTSSSGVQAGDNATFSNKIAGLVGTFTGTAIVMNDGGHCNLTPESVAPYLVAYPASGAKNFWWQLQATTTHSTTNTASSTVASTFCGFQ